MIVRPNYHWFRLLFVWRGSVLVNITGRLALIFALSIVSVLSRDWWIHLHADSALGIPPLTLMGIALAIFLGFRNTVSYDRFWEARKQWGALVVASRTLIRQVESSLTGAGQADARRQAVRLTSVFAYALNHQLRGSDPGQALALRLPPALAGELKSARFPAQRILLELARLLGEAQRAGRLSDGQWLAMDRSLTVMADTAGACERLAGTPIPYTYRVLMVRIVMAYCLLLPVGLATSIGWLTPLIATVIAYPFLALEIIGEQLEEPFGTEPNDLALDALCHTIEVSICELAGLEPLGEAPRPRDFVQT